MNEWICSLCGKKGYISDRDGIYCQTHWDKMEKSSRDQELEATKKAGGPWRQTCPYRGTIGPWSQGEDLDTWDIRTQFHKGLLARHCNFCGSLHPDDLIRLMRDEGYTVHGCDKAYKWYVHDPNGAMVSKFKIHHLSDEQRDQIKKLLPS